MMQWCTSARRAIFGTPRASHRSADQGRKSPKWVLLRIVVLLMAVLATPGVAPGEALALDSEEQVVLDLINQHRAQHGLPSLVLSPALSAAAASYSQAMAEGDFFSHVGLDGSTLRSRVRAAGYTYNTWLGENLAAGRGAGAQAFQQWVESPPHNANMLSPHYYAVGIGRAYNPASRYRWYWTIDFGGVVDVPVEAEETGTVGTDETNEG